MSPAGGRYRKIPVMTLRVAEPAMDPGQTVTNAASAAAVARTYFQSVRDDQERVLVMLLNQRHQVIALFEVSRGTLQNGMTHPREVFRPAVINSCAAIILAHNHPSGNPEPSPDDAALTRKMYEAGKVLGIELLDHIIIGDGGDQFYSFANSGGMKS